MGKQRYGVPVTIATLSKWGNSSAIRIPNQLLNRLDLKVGAEFEILVTDNNELLLRPKINPVESNEELRTHLQTLLFKVKQDTRHEEVELGLKGKEIF